MFRISGNIRPLFTRGIQFSSVVAATKLAYSTSSAEGKITAAAAIAVPDNHVFDLIVIGGGSGGMACARRAGTYGKKVAIVESKEFGGTCVNVGCVPKKIMYNAAHVAEVLHQSKHFGFNVENVSFDWRNIKDSRDAYIRRLSKIYENNLNGQQIQQIRGHASFDGSPTNPIVRVGNEVYKAKHIVIATGGAPKSLGVPGEEYAIDSDGFFALDHQPKKVAVIGGGYIGVEISGVFNALGTDTSLFIRRDHPLYHFDSMLGKHLDATMRKAGVRIVPQARASSIVKESDGKLTFHLTDGTTHSGFDVILSAIGRVPAVDKLNLGSIGVKLTKSGYIDVNEWQETSTTGVYAVGDVIENIQLTPVAIAAGRRLADRLFGGLSKAKMDYENVASVIFSHPTIGTIGLSEDEAVAKYGADNIKVYNSSFVNLWYGPFYGGGVGEKPVSKYKLVTLLPTEKVIGLHCIGESSDEVIQGFAVAMKLGATKADFDNAVAIHPTAAEEMVTMAPWGLSQTHKEMLK